MSEMIEVLLLWITLNSTYDASGIVHPVVIELSPEELTLEYYSDNLEFMPASGVDNRINALYSFEHSPAGAILVLACDAEYQVLDNCVDPIFRERVLHELVHHVQYQSGAYDAFLCKNSGEKDAYLLGGKYLKQRHIDDPLPNRNFWAHIYSRC